MDKVGNKIAFDGKMGRNGWINIRTHMLFDIYSVFLLPFLFLHEDFLFSGHQRLDIGNESVSK